MVTVVDPSNHSEELAEEDLPQHNAPLVAAIQGPIDRGEREEKLVASLGLDSVRLSCSELKQLRALVVEFADLFALDSSELGRTSFVTHSIDTGDSSPVRQSPRRVPFALRGKVCQLIDEMLEQGIVVPS